MSVKQLHLVDIYGGVLACNDLCRYNRRFLDNLDSFVRQYLPAAVPIHLLHPPEAPERIPRFALILLLEGTPENCENEHDKNGEIYHYHRLGIVSFIDQPHGGNLQSAIDCSYPLFERYA